MHRRGPLLCRRQRRQQDGVGLPRQVQVHQLHPLLPLSTDHDQRLADVRHGLEGARAAVLALEKLEKELAPKAKAKRKAPKAPKAKPAPKPKPKAKSKAAVKPEPKAAKPLGPTLPRLKTRSMK